MRPQQAKSRQKEASKSFDSKASLISFWGTQSWKSYVLLKIKNAR
jgi:hypothetical protein